MKKKTSIRLSKEAFALLVAIAADDGISNTAEFELMIRERAKKKGISVRETQDEAK